MTIHNQPFTVGQRALLNTFSLVSIHQLFGAAAHAYAIQVVRGQIRRSDGTAQTGHVHHSRVDKVAIAGASKVPAERHYAQHAEIKVFGVR